jgi:hypothetical protein
MIDKIFSQLDHWRNFPDYQLERRADIFFSLYIGDIIKAKYGSRVDFLIPEFPIQKGALESKYIRGANQSTKMDYLAVSEEDKQVYFIELKTNQGSLNPKQDEYLLKAKEININKLVEGVINIFNATEAKIKYGHLIHELSKIGWIDNTRVQPRNKSKDYEIKIVYILPENLENNADVISFDDIVSYLSVKDDDFTKRFIESIKKWKTLDTVPPKPSLFSK